MCMAQGSMNTRCHTRTFTRSSASHLAVFAGYVLVLMPQLALRRTGRLHNIWRQLACSLHHMLGVIPIATHTTTCNRLACIGRLTT